MNEKIKSLIEKAEYQAKKQSGYEDWEVYVPPDSQVVFEKFAELIIQSCIDKIETYRIPVGNSSSGELACEWTYAALKEIRDDIKEHFGVPNERKN